MNRIQCGLAPYTPLRRVLNWLARLGCPVWATMALDFLFIRYPSCAICEEEIGANPFCANCDEFRRPR